MAPPPAFTLMVFDRLAAIQHYVLSQVLGYVIARFLHLFGILAATNSLSSIFHVSLFSLSTPLRTLGGSIYAMAARDGPSELLPVEELRVIALALRRLMFYTAFSLVLQNASSFLSFLQWIRPPLTFQFFRGMVGVLWGGYKTMSSLREYFGFSLQEAVWRGYPFIHPFEFFFSLTPEDRLIIWSNTMLMAMDTVSRMWSKLWLFMPLRMPGTSGGKRLEPYEYEHLDESLPEIRLLRVEKKTPFSAVSCRLILFQLHYAPLYEAISYTWDGQTPDQTLIVDRKCLIVTKNVQKIVSDRASSKRTRWLWIDAVCINQEDAIEKSSQVAIMGNIYSSAERVIIWLENRGTTLWEALLALSLLEAAGRRVNAGPGPRDQPQERLGTIRMWKALELLVTHDYWFRIWIVQEVAQAKTVHILYGGRYISWNEFASLAIAGLTFGPLKKIVSASLSTSRTNYHKCLLGLTQIKKIWDFKSSVVDQKPAELADYLSYTLYFKATDPRDQIYALYSLVDRTAITPQNSQDIHPDYQVAMQDLYKRVAKLLFREKPNLAINRAGIGCGRSLLTLPSWVPDWTRERDETGVFTLDYEADEFKGLRYRAGGLCSYSSQSKDDDILKLEGIAIGAISKLSTKPYPYCGITESYQMGTLFTSPKALLDQFIQPILDFHNAAAILADMTPDIYSLTGQFRTEAFWRTLLGDRINIGLKDQFLPGPLVEDGFPAPDEFGIHYRDWWNWLHDTRDSLQEGKFPKKKIPTSADLFVIALDTTRQEGKFAVTTNGLMTNVPPFAAPGDQICVVPGLAKPVVLRPSKSRSNGDSEDTWLLVGECYVHGLMRGEALEREHEVKVFLIE